MIPSHSASDVLSKPLPVDPVLAKAPHRIGKVTLRVRDLDPVCGFYRHALGLQVVEQETGLVRLGTDASILIELRHDPDARVASRRETGLFHTAFLLPQRADLGAWLTFAAEQRLPLAGASDHLVSEAVYLSDPEGNGIEIYVDRPSAEWSRSGGMIEMTSEPLDLRDLARAAAGSTWAGLPRASVIGHVHLQVGEIAAAEAFYSGVLGFEITSRYPGGSFYGSGGYHHQLATNIWNSRGAPPRSAGLTGLADIEILTDGSVFDALLSQGDATSSGSASGPSVSFRDPWGTSITLRAN